MIGIKRKVVVINPQKIDKETKPHVIGIKRKVVEVTKPQKIDKETKHHLWTLFTEDKNAIRQQNMNSEKHTCPEIFHSCQVCQLPLTIMDDGFPTCTNQECGTMYQNVLDYTPEWRVFGGGNDRNNNQGVIRCGNPINELLIESSFGCRLLCDNRSSYQMKRLCKWTEWQATPHKEKALYEEFQFITIMAQNAGIPKVFIDHAISIHKDVSAQKLFRGMNRDGMKAASIYISCRLNGCPRTAHEIAEIFQFDKQSTTNGCSTAVTILNNMQRNMDPSMKTSLGIFTPSGFIERFSSRLNLSQEAKLLAKFVTMKVEKERLICDNTPQSLAASILCFVASICGKE